MKFIIGEKLDMTQIWQDDRKIAVTRVKVAPCKVTQIKTTAKDGYEAVQIGSGAKKTKNINKAQLGHFKDLGNFRYLKEFRIDNIKGKDSKPELTVGDTFDVSTFEAGDAIQATAITKGRGFQGVVKRHGFHGQDKTHGNKDQLRMPGSIGATGPAHVFKGLRMPGRMGADQVTIKNLTVAEVDTVNGILSVAGGIPGARNGLVIIAGIGELKLASDKPEVIEETPAEEVATIEEVETVKEEKVEAPTEEVSVKEVEEEKAEENKEETK